MIDDIKIASIVYENVKGVKTMIQNLVKSRFLQESANFMTNDMEQQAINEILSGINVEVLCNGESLSTEITYTNKGDFFQLITGGQGQVTVGGASGNGVIRLPNGGTAQSRAPQMAWGNKTNIYARQGISLQDEINSMVKTVFTDSINDAVAVSESQIAKAVAPIISKELNKILQGGV